MLSDITTVLRTTTESLRIAVELLFYSACFFGFITLLVKGRQAFVDLRRASAEVRMNLSIAAFDTIFIAPAIAIGVTLIRLGVDRLGIGAGATLWTGVGETATFVAVLFLGDFVGYWRHRFEHTRWLWPAHAIHHSDTQMTWLTLARFHPFDRVVTAALDITCLALLGFPAWALVAYELVRHYYGEFIHADFPWTYGPIGRVFVSPVMHRWHHARDVTGAGSNFATIFSVFDQAFGTYYVPGLCTVPLGVRDDIGPGLVGQLSYPMVAWSRELSDAIKSRTRRTLPSGPASGER